MQLYPLPNTTPGRALQQLGGLAQHARSTGEEESIQLDWTTSATRPA